MNLSIQDLRLNLGDFTLNAHIDLPSGELITLLGPSGCGKTTLLRTIAGLYDVQEGRIFMGEKEISHTNPSDREIGMVFQDYALFPHMSVGKNIRYGLKLRGAEGNKRVNELLKLVHLENYEDRSITELSGGEKQRVALARALAAKPKILLLDEPLSALDASLRKVLRRQIKEIQVKTGLTMIYVTHDQEEAMAISDRIVLMNQGRIEQFGNVRDLYERPETAFSASFIGQGNFIDHPSASGQLFFRPENCLTGNKEVPENWIGGEGEVVYQEFAGNCRNIELLWEGQIVKLSQDRSMNIEIGSRIYWSVKLSDCICF